MDRSQKTTKYQYFAHLSVRLLLLVWIFALLWHLVILFLLSFFDVTIIKKERYRDEEYRISLISTEAASQSSSPEDDEIVAPLEPQETQKKSEEKPETTKVAGVGESTSEETPQENPQQENPAEENSKKPEPNKKKIESIAFPWKKQEKNPSTLVSSNEQNALVTAGGNQIYGLRQGDSKKQALQQYGGNAASENSVEKGLRWLSNHQDSDGKWNAPNFQDNCNHKECIGRGFQKYTPGVTGLAMLAFLAAGHGPNKGKYQKEMQRTEKYLLRTQNADGYFDEDMYNHAVVLLVLTELYSLSKSTEIASAVRQGILASIRAQHPQGGWTYTAGGVPRSDTSISGWMVLALVACKRSGFRVPSRVLDRAWKHFTNMSDASGMVRYSDVGPNSFRTTNSLVAVRLLMGMLLGKRDAAMTQQLKILLNSPPNWSKRKGLDNCMYYWYHGTLAMFLVGGQSWKYWNSQTRDMLIDNQEKTGHAEGSWSPSTKWGSSGGRVYSTALCVLTLEVYYRYHPNFVKQGTTTSLPE